MKNNINKAFINALYKKEVIKYNALFTKIKINQKCDFFKETPLIAAIKNKNYEVVNKLLKLGADPNCIDEGGVRPITHAIKFTHLDIIDRLIFYKADILYEDKYNPNILNSLCVKLNLLVKDSLIKNINYVDHHDCLTLIDKFVKSSASFKLTEQIVFTGLTNEIKILENKIRKDKYNLNTLDSFKNPLFFNLCNSGKVLSKFEETIVYNSINLNIKNFKGENFLHFLIKYSDVYKLHKINDIIKLCIKNNININEKDGDGNNIINLLLCNKGLDDETLKTLIDNKINLFDSNYNLQTPLHIAIKNMNVNMCLNLINTGLDFLKIDKSGRDFINYFILADTKFHKNSDFDKLITALLNKNVDFSAYEKNIQNMRNIEFKNSLIKYCVIHKERNMLESLKNNFTKRSSVVKL